MDFVHTPQRDDEVFSFSCIILFFVLDFVLFSSVDVYRRTEPQGLGGENNQLEINQFFLF